MPERRFRMAPGIELVLVSEGRYTLRSEFDAVELSGEAATEFAQKVLAELDEPLGLDAICAKLPRYSPHSVTSQLEALVTQGLVVEQSDDDGSPPLPFAAFLDAVGQNAGETARSLAGAKVAVFGLEAHGAHLARMLAQVGIGTVRLIDPFRFEPGHLAEEQCGLEFGEPEVCAGRSIAEVGADHPETAAIVVEGVGAFAQVFIIE